MMPDLTFVIPISPKHVQLAERAIQSVRNQTQACLFLTREDKERRGPGYLRNEMLSEVRTPFVSFLDADDWIEPTFAEETLGEYRRSGGNVYIYTDWLDDDGTVVEAPCRNGSNGHPISVPGGRPYCGGTWHAITTLLPLDWALAARFDESLPAVEDTEFYLKLCTSFRCGHHLARPLFHYSANGGRAADFYHGQDRERVMNELTLRYGGKMGCCGNNERVVAPIGAKQQGDVLAMALWQGNRTEHGRVTGRIYPRISVPRTTWVDPRDVEQSPMLWRRVDQLSVDSQPPLTLPQMANMAMAGAKIPSPPAPVVVSAPEAPTAVTMPLPTSTPDVNRVILLGRSAQSQSTDPVFVFPDKNYPSYRDVRKLVELSNFRVTDFKHIDSFSRAPHIVLSPEAIPDLNGLRARIICWQLEYAGDYTRNYEGFKGEVWASDKVWAAEHNAKYVLMGSHPELALMGNYQTKDERVGWLYDVTMLAYMTPRRQAVKDTLSELRWPVDYPGHDNQARANLLWATRLMLNVHQHENAPYIAPQRIALAAAYHMPVLSETVRDPGDLEHFIIWQPYSEIPAFVRDTLQSSMWDDGLFEYLCKQRTFRQCVEEALK